jgi:hypothetical protein
VGARLALDRVLKYLRCTSDFSIGGHRTKEDIVKYYSDSDLAGDSEVTNLSRTGTMIILNDIPVSWKSHLQGKEGRGIAVSSAVAEIYALYESGKVCQDYTWRANETNMKLKTPIVVFVDNDQAISFTNSTCTNSRLRGSISRKQAWVQELKSGGLLTPKYINTKNNLADIMTKALREGRHSDLIKQIQREKTSAEGE